MSGSGFEVVHIQIGTKNKINKNTQRETVSRGSTQQKYTLEKLKCARTVSAHTLYAHSLLPSAPAHTSTHTLLESSPGSQF